MKRIEIIKGKLNQLKNLDKRFSTFGSSRHKYKFNRPLSEKEISQIETDNEIVLSDDYKELLKYLGNGGAGCGYGLEKLELKKINPPYIGTKKLLRNWEDPKKIECDMVELDEISGYIKLFDYGCGMEYCLIVNGEEKEDLIFFDCDGRFEKIENKSLFDTYENWLDESLTTMKRVKDKLIENTVEEVIKEEWANKNFSIRGMIYSIMDINVPEPKHHTEEYKDVMEKLRLNWLTPKNPTVNKSTSNKWWNFGK
jgi:hypothetical protein